jgi:hypothetical protein
MELKKKRMGKKGEEHLNIDGKWKPWITYCKEGILNQTSKITSIKYGSTSSLPLFSLTSNCKQMEK